MVQKSPASPAPVCLDSTRPHHRGRTDHHQGQDWREVAPWDVLASASKDKFNQNLSYLTVISGLTISKIVLPNTLRIGCFKTTLKALKHRVVLIGIVT